MNDQDKKCAPSKKFTDGSCFTLDSLKLIAENYNNKNDDKILIVDDKKKLTDQIKKKLSTECNTQTCWLRLDVIKELNNSEINDNTFRPEGPKEQYDWLSTTHINDVISQYHDLYKDFIFLGAVPYDFEDVELLGLNNIDFDNLNSLPIFNNGDVLGSKNKINKFGIVINLDEHYKSGSHWVALYSDLAKNQIYFFDSFAKKPRKRIRKFINKIFKHMYQKKYNKEVDINKFFDSNDKEKRKLLDKIKDFDIRFNHIQHQFKNSECGVYSINFILRLAKGESFDDIINNITKDDEMNQCRSTYFTNV